MGALSKREFIRSGQRDRQQDCVLERQIELREHSRERVESIAETLAGLYSRERARGVDHGIFRNEPFDLVADRKGQTLKFVISGFVEDADLSRGSATITLNCRMTCLFGVAVNERPDPKRGQSRPALDGLRTSLMTDEAHGQGVAADVTVVPVIGNAHLTSSTGEEGFDALVG